MPFMAAFMADGIEVWVDSLHLRYQVDFLFCFWRSRCSCPLWQQLWLMALKFRLMAMEAATSLLDLSCHAARRPQLPSVDPQLHRICFSFFRYIFPLCICNRLGRRPKLAGRSSRVEYFQYCLLLPVTMLLPIGQLGLQSNVDYLSIFCSVFACINEISLKNNF